MEEIYKKGTILLRKPIIDEQSEKQVATEEVKDEINGQSKTEKQHKNAASRIVKVSCFSPGSPVFPTLTTK